jgi:hypothetical protein
LGYSVGHLVEEETFEGCFSRHDGASIKLFLGSYLKNRSGCVLRNEVLRLVAGYRWGCWVLAVGEEVELKALSGGRRRGVANLPTTSNSINIRNQR